MLPNGEVVPIPAAERWVAEAAAAEAAAQAAGISTTGEQAGVIQDRLEDIRVSWIAKDWRL
jgi:hypothetical protein